MRNLLIILSLLFVYPSYTQDVKTYELQLLEAYTKYYELKAQEGNDIVLDPIETVPMPLTASESPSNWAKALYVLPKISPQVKVVFFILDTEGHFFHKDLQEVAWNDEGKVFTGETSKGNVNGHGIHCAGVIGSSKEGLLYPYKDFIRIIPYKVLRDNGSGSFSQIVNGINAATSRAIQLKAQGYECIISMSLGAQAYNASVNQAVKNAVNNGVYVFAASGNNGTEFVGTPANSPGAFAVGSINEQLSKSYFSNYGKEMYMVAPGEKINSTFIRDSYAVLQGTSMACPNAAAALGYELMAGRKSLLFNDIDPLGWDKFTGNGYFTKKTSVDTLPFVRTSLVEVTGEYPLLFNESVGFVSSVTLEVDSKLKAEVLTKSLSEQVQMFFTNRTMTLEKDQDLQEAVLFSGYFLGQFLNTKGYKVKVLEIKGGTNNATVTIESKQINNRRIRYDASQLVQQFSQLIPLFDIGLIVLYEKPNVGNPNHCQQVTEFRVLRYVGNLPSVEQVKTLIDVESCNGLQVIYTHRLPLNFYKEEYPVINWPVQ